MPTPYEQSYLELIDEVMRDGNRRKTRNAETISTFGKVLVVDELVHSQFPILKGRKLYPKGVFGELAAFLKGPKTLKDFENEGCNYWKQWAKPDGTINVDYGNSWLDFNGVNQLDDLLVSLATDPNGRRHIISGWRPDKLQELDLPCCHMLYQWYVNGDKLEMIWYQRSVDVMVGLPSDVILAAAWNIIIAEELGLQPGKLTFMLGDTHIYTNHLPKVVEYLGGALHTSSASVGYFNEGTLATFNKNSISLIDYTHLAPIKFEVIA